MNLERIPPYLWLAFDWSAAELCYIALQARDPVLKAMVESGDPHTWTARELGYRNATKTDPIREACKSVNYALVYSGMDLNVARAICIKKNPDIDPAMVDFAISRYPSMFPRLFEWADEALCEWYDRGGYVTYAMGSVKKDRGSGIRAEGSGEDAGVVSGQIGHQYVRAEFHWISAQEVVGGDVAEGYVPVR